MFLGIEIGGTKLQLGVGAGADDTLVSLEHRQVVPSNGATGIREQIASIAPKLIQRFSINAIGIGFGGPVDAATGTTLTSFQIPGWERFSLRDWSQGTLGLPTAIENDSNLAGLGEARFGAGKEASVVFYSNVGSGIGGALIVDGRLYVGNGAGAVAEIGHLRPGPQAVNPEETVESVASGWGIAKQALVRMERKAESESEACEDMWIRCDRSAEQLTGQIVAEAAIVGNSLAAAVLKNAIVTYGWSLAQAITLFAPDVVVVGGGISQLGEDAFFEPLRAEVSRFVMAPLERTYEIVPARLGESVVLHGAIALAASSN